jgi:hypothetical protein
MHLRIGMDFRRLPYLVPVFMIPSQSIRARVLMFFIPGLTAFL